MLPASQRQEGMKDQPASQGRDERRKKMCVHMLQRAAGKLQSVALWRGVWRVARRGVGRLITSSS